MGTEVLPHSQSTLDLGMGTEVLPHPQSTLDLGMGTEVLSHSQSTLDLGMGTEVFGVGWYMTRTYTFWLLLCAVWTLKSSFHKVWHL